MSIDVDFKRQREIAEILRCNNPIAKVLSRRDEYYVPEAHLLLCAPNQLSRDRDGNLRSVPFSFPTTKKTQAAGVEGTEGSKNRSSTSTPEPGNNTAGAGKKVQFGTSGAGEVSKDAISSTQKLQPILRHPSESIRGEEDGEEDIMTSKDFASIVISERKLLAVKNTRKQHLLKRSLQKELVASQLRVKTCRNGGSHPCKPTAAEFASYNNPLGCSASPIPLLESPPPALDLLTSPTPFLTGVGNNRSVTAYPTQLTLEQSPTPPDHTTLGGEMDKENYFDALEDGEDLAPDFGAEMVKASSFFFTQPDDQRQLVAPSEQLQWSARPSGGPLALPPLTSTSANSSKTGIAGLLTTMTPKLMSSSVRSTESNEVLQQKRRDEYVRFKDVSCSRILARDYTPEPDAAPAAGTGGASSTSSVSQSGGRSSSAAGRTGSISPTPSGHRAAAGVRSLSVIPAPKLFHAQGGGKLPPIEGYSNLMCATYKESDAFLTSCMSQIERRNADRKKKYLKKFAALNLSVHLPFHATANAILHHVERLIVKEDRESTWREEHDAALKLFREIELYCRQHFSNPQSLELLRETRCILVDEQTVPEAPMFNARLMKLLPPTSFLLDEVVTVASHLSVLYGVSKGEAIEYIRERASSFVEDHTVDLVSQLNLATATTPIGGGGGGGAIQERPDDRFVGFEEAFDRDSNDSDGDDGSENDALFSQRTGVFGDK